MNDLHITERRFISFKDFIKGNVIKLKSVWTTLKRKIATLFSAKLKRAQLGEEVEITIPIEMEVEVEKQLKESGALAAIQGNYNEILVLSILYSITSQYVDIAEKYEKYRALIFAGVSKWANDLKNKVTPESFAKAESIIIRGSEDMAKYLITEAAKNDAVIIGGYSDNLSFQRGGISSKADIQLVVRKEGNEILQGYSLKLYTSKSVSLSNTTAVGLARHLGGEKAAAAVAAAIQSDSRLIGMIARAKFLDKTKQELKRVLSKNTKDNVLGIRELKKLNYSENDIAKLDIKQVDADRATARKPINPRVSEIVYNVLKKYVGTEEFADNILRIMGFNDKDTKMLMSVVTFGKTGMKSQIIDKHPELDLSKISLKLSGVTLHVKAPNGKTLLTFGIKEGEKTNVSGKVSFADVDPYDLADTLELYADK